MKTAKLRTCAACEWVFIMDGDSPECPKCGFGSYGAHYVYGDRAYSYVKTQKPWKDNKMARYSSLLDREINDALKQEPPISLDYPG